MNHFILSDSHKCIGCKACEVACVMAHNDEQHVLTPQRFSAAYYGYQARAKT
ncbi:glutamate synthase small subunit [Klebsiella grimontii]|uniref:Glutamate synthase small subunit n=1 Tax=Klebsiella grimontii TaxID=2058152 RepID=A0A7H4NZ52_9ENTR|nr:glutamate synthase small subunit [Klebsiella grimontii]